MAQNASDTDAPIKRTIEFSTDRPDLHRLDLDDVEEGHAIGIDASRFDLGLPEQDIDDIHTLIQGDVTRRSGIGTAHDLWVETPSGAELHVYPQRGKVERIDDGERVDHDFGEVYDVSTLRNAVLAYLGADDQEDSDDDRDGALPGRGELEVGDEVWTHVWAWRAKTGSGVKLAEIVGVDGDEITVESSMGDRQTIPRSAVLETSLEPGDRVTVSYESPWSDERVERDGAVVRLRERRGSVSGVIVEREDGREIVVDGAGGVRINDEGRRRIGSDPVVERQIVEDGSGETIVGNPHHSAETATESDECVPDGGREEDESDDVEAIHEIADLEATLRESSTQGSELLVGGNRRSARIYFDTWELNEHHRGTLTASVATAVAESDAWEIVTIHDPIEREEGEAGIVQSPITIRRDSDTSEGVPRGDA